MSARLSKIVGKRIADRYCVTGEIGVGGMGRVYRAMPFDDPSHDVAIKVIQRNRQLNSEDLLRFQKEAALMSRLHHPNIICFHELGLLQSGQEKEFFGNGYYIVMEIANGMNLKQSLEKDGRKDLAFFFQVAVKVTDALDYTHGKNIIHRDIKPQNIVVGKAVQDQRGLNVKVLDFGVARLAEAMHFTSADGTSRQGFHDIAGTPMYMAPEQTHLMDAPIDHRVDLYSLGCVLYEVLAGKPPFTASTREKLERQHVYSNPEPLATLRPDIPPIIEDIVHKLLRKHPRERYQSAFALQADLLRAKRRLERRERPSSIMFPLGLNDRLQSVSAKLALVGRDDELKVLVAGYEATAQERGRSRLSVVQGPAGLGKTRLLAEFRNYLSQRKIRFISANFSQHENALPFNALANGFNDYLIRVLKSQPHEAEELRRKVKTLLGPTAYQVAAVVPGLNPFIPEGMERNEEYDGFGDFRTFSKAFSDFTRCLATDNQPVVFIFDDLHWADEKSLELIDQFFSHNNSQRFFMVISYRSNDPMATPRFASFLEKFRKLRRRYQEMELKPFDVEATKEISEKMLSAPEGIAEELVSYLQNMANGNPMHLVETVRALVSRDLIHLSREGELVYDVAEIERSNLRFRSVDLVLSRIQELPAFDRTTLEIAATIGMTFQFELLLIEERQDSVKVMKALQRAVEEGLISRIADEADFKHLGKSYSFTHWRARDVLYQNIPRDRRMFLHESIAGKLEESISKPTAKGIFALAHHVNRALEEGRAHEEQLARKCIDYNILAGQEAKKSESWQSAQRYFENAFQQMEFWPEGSPLREKRALVIENLADLAALLRRLREALNWYDELAAFSLDQTTFAAIAFKKVNLQIHAGIVSKSIGFLRQYMNTLMLPTPSGGWLDKICLWRELILDAMPVSLGKHRLYKLLKSAYRRAKHDHDENERQFFAARLYHLGQLLYLQHKPKFSLYYHTYALRACLYGQAASSTIIRTVGDRAALLGYFGNSKLGYNLIDLAMDAARSAGDRNTFGYLSLLRALSLDYLRDKDDEVRSNLRAALRYLSKDQERIWYGIGLEYQMYRELMRGNLDLVQKFSSKIPDHIQTRNWLSPRCMALLFYGLLLADSRDEIVRKGENYLRRRDQVGGRSQELFHLLINVLVSFARGDVEKTRKYYTAAMFSYVNGNTTKYLYPFEEDFVGLFAFSFPLIFEQEHRRRLMRDSEMTNLYKHLYRRVHNIRGRRRGITSLICARSREILHKKNIKPMYDEALKSAKISGNLLTLTFSYLWFGDHLLRQGIRNRNEYLRKAHGTASSLNLGALVEYIEKVMEKRGISFRRSPLKRRLRDMRRKFGPFRSRMVFEHIEHITEVLRLDTALEQNIEESIAVLAREYQCERAVCILHSDQMDTPVVIHPYNLKDATQVLEYVAPYINIRSTLFLPATDAPWAAGNHSRSDVGASSTMPTPVVRSSLASLDVTESLSSAKMDQTVVLDNQAITPISHIVSPEDTAVTNLVHGTMVHDNSADGSPQRSLRMSALVPIRFGDKNCGVLFLEDVDLTNKETTACHAELDVFGAQLGLLVEKKAEPATGASLSHLAGGAEFRYRPGEYTLEELPWLRLWTRGRLRASRENTWYLGLRFSNEHYLLTYCRLNGPQEVREKVSEILWHQLLVLRTLSQSSGRNDFDILEVKEDIAAQLNCFPAAKSLDNCSISFTVFNKEKRLATSGHFGRSRPIVLCQENQVTPDNRVILTLNNGRDLRYWSVTASLSGPHAYILPHDSSKLEVKPSDTQRRSIASSLMDSDARQELNLILERLILKENLPRYYVAAVQLDEEAEEGFQASQYDRAD